MYGKDPGPHHHTDIRVEEGSEKILPPNHRRKKDTVPTVCLKCPDYFDFDPRPGSTNAERGLPQYEGDTDDVRQVPRNEG